MDPIRSDECDAKSQALSPARPKAPLDVTGQSPKARPGDDDTPDWRGSWCSLTPTFPDEFLAEVFGAVR